MEWSRVFPPCAWGAVGIGASGLVTLSPPPAGLEKLAEDRLLSLITLAGMLLGSCLLAAVGRRLAGLLEAWRRDSLEPGPVAVPRFH